MRVSPTINNSNTEIAATKDSKAAAAAREAKKKEKTGAAANSAVNTEGSVNANISAKGKEFARAKEIASNAPDVREEKIAELKLRIAAGKYNVDPRAVADRMVDEHLKTAGSG